MNTGLLYNITKPYEENFEKGPPLLSTDIKPKQRNLNYSSSEARSLNVHSSHPESNRRVRTIKHTFLGFKVNMPFGIPAGPLLNSTYVKTAFEFGFDVCVYKTQRSRPLEVNQHPNIVFVDVDGDLTLDKAKKGLVGSLTTNKQQKDFSITNSFGNPSKGPTFWQDDVKKAMSYAGKGQLLIGSVCGTMWDGQTEEEYFQDFATAAREMNETGVKVVEVNLSCPNCATEGVICYTPSAVETIVRQCKEAIGTTPLVAKIGYYEPSQQELLETVVKKMLPYVAAISAINTIPAPVVDDQGNQKLPGKNRLTSGICGASIKWAGLDMVKRLAKLKKKLNAPYEIIGVGGVMTPHDYQKYRDAGADLVQSATGAMWNPDLAYEIWESEKQ